MELPFVDSHCVKVAAPADVVWAKLLSNLPMMSRGTARTAYARLVGCREVRPSGGPLKEGSEIVGFRVVRSVPGELLLLDGQHRFSRYTLSFRLNQSDGLTELCADTHAEFPGAPGKLYRSVVIGSRGHLVLMKLMLQKVKRSAERIQDAELNRAERLSGV